MRKNHLFLLMCLLPSTSLYGGDHALKLGPASVGSGGTNPVILPAAHPSYWEYTYVSKDGFEVNLATAPGLLLGGRLSRKGLYVSGGGGVLLSLNGPGFGVYNSFGYITGDATPGWHFNFEYKQTLGYSGITKQWISPGALRVGIIWK